MSKWEINLKEPDRFQKTIISNDGYNDKYFIRASVLGVNYIASFIEVFEATFKRKVRILEYGDGISTLWLAKNFPENEIYSIGGDTKWYDWMEEELAKIPNHNTKHIYKEATNYYTTEVDKNDDYAKIIDELNPPFDVIINDGAQREIIGDYILSNADKYISEGGIYLRHDYEMAILGNWVGKRNELPKWCRDEMDLGYEGFVASHPNYNLVTVTGNGRWGYVMEYGGVWRKMDHQWKRKLEGVAQ